MNFTVYNYVLNFKNDSTHDGDGKEEELDPLDVTSPCVDHQKYFKDEVSLYKI